MYQCNDCHLTFEEPITEAELVDASVGYYEPRFYCPDPDCHSEEVEQVIDCPMCQQTYIKSDKDRCGDCETTTRLLIDDAIMQIACRTGAARDEILKAMAQWLENQ